MFDQVPCSRINIRLVCLGPALDLNNLTMFSLLLLIGVLSLKILFSNQLGDIYRMTQPYIWIEKSLDWTYKEENGLLTLFELF